jgi:hypothetical protein
MECAAEHGIDLNDPVRRVFPEYALDYRFIDIINHRTRLQNDWGGSALQRRYFECHDIYRFALELKDDEAVDRAAFRYNNYTYNILAAAVQVLSGVHVHRRLEASLLAGVRYQWYKQGKGKTPHGSFGLAVHIDNLARFARNMLALFRRHPLPFFHFRRTAVCGRRRLALVGHTGSGGQYAFFDERSGSLLLWMYGGPEMKPYGDCRPLAAFNAEFAQALSGKTMVAEDPEAPKRPRPKPRPKLSRPQSKTDGERKNFL